MAFTPRDRAQAATAPGGAQAKAGAPKIEQVRRREAQDSCGVRHDAAGAGHYLLVVALLRLLYAFMLYTGLRGAAPPAGVGAGRRERRPDAPRDGPAHIRNLDQGQA